MTIRLAYKTNLPSVRKTLIILILKISVFFCKHREAVASKHTHDLWVSKSVILTFSNLFLNVLAKAVRINTRAHVCIPQPRKNKSHRCLERTVMLSPCTFQGSKQQQNNKITRGISQEVQKWYIYLHSILASEFCLSVYVINERKGSFRLWMLL